MKVLGKLVICGCLAFVLHTVSSAEAGNKSNLELASKDANVIKSTSLKKALKEVKKEIQIAERTSNKPNIEKLSKLHKIRGQKNNKDISDKQLNFLAPASFGKNNATNTKRINAVGSDFSFPFIDGSAKQNNFKSEKQVLNDRKLPIITKTAGEVLLQAIKNPKKIDWQDAYSKVASSGSKDALKLLRWIDYKRNDTRASFEHIISFVGDNPDWPSIYTLKQNAEQKSSDAVSKKGVTDWFQTFAPVSIEGKVTYISALLNQNRIDDATAEIGRVWAYTKFTGKQQKEFLAEFGKYISKEQHANRADNLLWQRRATETSRFLHLLDSDSQKLAKARIALIFHSSGVDKIIKAVPKKMQSDPGLLYERAVWRKMHKQYQRTADFINDHAEATKTHPEKWWRLRKSVAMKLLGKGKIDVAYNLISSHNMAHEGISFADAEWLAGWIALRFKKNDKLAFEHFERLYDNVSSAVSKSRGAYWSGEAAQTFAPDKSGEYFRKAAFFSTTFYGQLAAAKINNRAYSPLPAEPKPNNDLIEQVKSDELIRIVYILSVLDQDKLMKVFVSRLYDMAETPEKVAALAEVLGDYVRRPDMSVVVARRARMDGIELTESGYPVVREDLGQDVLEKSLMLAIVRQESSFQIDAVSAANAYGIMQIIPSTARNMSKSLGMDYSTAKLQNDPIYNMTLGTNYLKNMVERFDGSYVLAIAAYNAGPHRVAKWIKKYGDPRKGDINMVDWIESIPYSETQNYVQRVIENLQVYRRLFGDDAVTQTLQGNLRGKAEDVFASNEAMRRNM
jgi:soluble lytic murein transglycosylase